MSETTAPYIARFQAQRATLPGAGLAWLDRLRDGAMDRFAAEGFPTPKSEAWKYTNLSRMARAACDAEPSAAAQTLAETGDAHRLVFLDGRFSPENSDIGAPGKGVTLATLAEMMANDPARIEELLGESAAGDGLAALNTAMMRDGLVLILDDGAALEKPVHLLFHASNATAVHPRNLVLAGAGSRATVIETYTGAATAAYWTNAVSEISLGANAEIEHVRLQREGGEAYHVGLTRARLARDARYRGFLLSSGARLARAELRATVAGEGTDCRLAGGALARGRQHSDITTDITHAAAHSTSRQLFKNVLDDHGRAVFQGRITVAEDAQKIDAGQTNRNLLLSPGAHADSKPELRIFADDVKCSHGATTGDLDREAMFYLTSRGIDTAGARALLIRAFIGELCDEVNDPAARAVVEDAVADWLGVAAEERIAA